MFIRALPLIMTSLLFPEIGFANPVDTIGTTQLKALRKQALEFELKDDLWLVNGKRRPVLETELSGVNYMTLTNSSGNASLNLVIPKFEYSVLAKNDTAFAKPYVVNEEDSGNTLLWIEPKSRLVISFTNDLAQSPMQGIVAVFRSKPEVAAIFGPRASLGFSLLPTEKAVTVPLSELGLKTYSQPSALNTHATELILKAGKETLRAGHSYRIQNQNQAFKLEFSEVIFISSRNKFIGGSGYWSKSFSEDYQ